MGRKPKLTTRIKRSRLLLPLLLGLVAGIAVYGVSHLFGHGPISIDRWAFNTTYSSTTGEEYIIVNESGFYPVSPVPSSGGEAEEGGAGAGIPYQWPSNVSSFLFGISLDTSSMEFTAQGQPGKWAVIVNVFMESEYGSCWLDFSDDYYISMEDMSEYGLPLGTEIEGGRASGSYWYSTEYQESMGVIQFEFKVPEIGRIAEVLTPEKASILTGGREGESVPVKATVFAAAIDESGNVLSGFAEPALIKLEIMIPEETSVPSGYWNPELTVVWIKTSAGFHAILKPSSLIDRPMIVNVDLIRIPLAFTIMFALSLATQNIRDIKDSLILNAAGFLAILVVLGVVW